MAFSVSGFREAVLSVRDMTPWHALFCDTAGWQLAHRGAPDNSLLEFWRAKARHSAEESLLVNPGDSSGYLRIYQLNSAGQEEIRAATHSWDSGGIFDLNLRIHSTDAVYPLLLERSWQPVSAPVPWRFGSSEVTECLLRGPDAAVFAIIERRDPPLRGWNFQTFSRVFNSSQVVGDMKAALDFYQALGFQQVVSHSGPLPNLAGRVLGLSAQEAASEALQLRILHPQGEMDGSVELVEFTGKNGKDLSSRALPTNLGITALCFPVSNIREFASHLERQQISMQTPGIIETHIEPYGTVNLLAVQTPDGAWLEFFETGK